MKRRMASVIPFPQDRNHKPRVQSPHKCTGWSPMLSHTDTIATVVGNAKFRAMEKKKKIKKIESIKS